MNTNETQEIEIPAKWDVTVQAAERRGYRAGVEAAKKAIMGKVLLLAKYRKGTWITVEAAPIAGIEKSINKLLVGYTGLGSQATHADWKAERKKFIEALRPVAKQDCLYSPDDCEKGVYGPICYVCNARAVLAEVEEKK